MSPVILYWIKLLFCSKPLVIPSNYASVLYFDQQTGAPLLQCNVSLDTLVNWTKRFFQKFNFKFPVIPFSRPFSTQKQKNEEERNKTEKQKGNREKGKYCT